MNPTSLNAPLQINIESYDPFIKRFQQWSLGWLAITFLFTLFIDYTVFHNQPRYLHDWHLPIIILLSSMIIGAYAFSVLYKHTSWPPPLSISLPCWFAVYVIVLLLSKMDTNFAWYLFILFGMSLATLRGRWLFALITVLYITVCALNNFLTWPFDLDNIGSMIGLSFSFYGTTALAVMIQSLVSERYKRARILQELSQANTELAEAHQKLAETAAQEQELAVLRERTRLAREMHDTLGHALVLVTVKLEIAQRLRERDPERCERELEATQEIVRASMNELRASIAHLRSPALEQEPACRALSRFAREVGQRGNIHVIYDINPDIDGLPEQVEETLWKVGQEALVNVEKHAQARTLTLSMSRQDARVLMRIEDDGIGLPCCLLKSECYESPEGHYGLNGMRERVESLGGRLQLRRGEAHGTVVEVELPLIEVLV